MGYMSARKQYAMPEMDESSSQSDSYMVPEMYSLGDSKATTNVPEYSSGDMSGAVLTGATTGAATGGPAGAAIGAGGAFLTQYIAQRAADERAKRAAIGQAYQNQASNEQNIINSIMATNARALR